jgi:hypothetical protein
MTDRSVVPPAVGSGKTWTYFLEGPYLCAGIQTDCGDAGKAQLHGRFHHTRGLDTCSLSFLFSRDLKATTGVKRMKVYQQKTKVVIQQSEETFAKQRNKAGVRDKRDIRLSLR